MQVALPSDIHYVYNTTHLQGEDISEMINFIKMMYNKYGEDLDQKTYITCFLDQYFDVCDGIFNSNLLNLGKNCKESVSQKDIDCVNRNSMYSGEQVNEIIRFVKRMCINYGKNIEKYMWHLRVAMKDVGECLSEEMIVK